MGKPVPRLPLPRPNGRPGPGAGGGHSLLALRLDGPMNCRDQIAEARGLEADRDQVIAVALDRQTPTLAFSRAAGRRALADDLIGPAQEVDATFRGRGEVGGRGSRASQRL